MQLSSRRNGQKEAEVDWIKWVIIVLACFEGGWLVFDGSRAMLVGDYVTPKAGPYAGQLGPWSKFVSAVGIEPRSTLMKLIHVLLGTALVSVAVLHAVGVEWARTGVVVCAALCLWYLPLGTMLSLILLILLFLPVT